MEFEITATIETTREVAGTINVTKQDVVDAGFCKSVEDGDSTAWYGYVADFLKQEFESSEYDYYASEYGEGMDTVGFRFLELLNNSDCYSTGVDIRKIEC